MAAILNFPLPVSTYSIRNSSIVLLDPENMGVAVEILFLGAIEPEIRWGVILPPPLVILRWRKTLEQRGLRDITTIFGDFVDI